MGTSVPRGRGYGIFLAFFLLLYLVLTLIRAGAAAFRFERDRFEWRAYWNYAPSLGKRKNMLLQSPEKAGWGMRYLFILKGTLTAGEKPLYSVRAGKVFTERLLFEQILPLPGLFNCRGRLYMSDIFGFVRFPPYRPGAQAGSLSSPPAGKQGLSPPRKRPMKTKRKYRTIRPIRKKSSCATISREIWCAT